MELQHAATITSDEFLCSLIHQTDPAKDFFTTFSEPRFYIGELGVDRNTLANWEGEGLLPYEKKEGGWRKFSFFEALWLKLIEAYRKIGLPLDKIKRIKEALFSYESVIHFLGNNQMKGLYQQTLIKHGKTPGAFTLPGESFFIDNQISSFSLSVLSVLLTKNDHGLFFFDNGDVTLLRLTELPDPRYEQARVMQYHEALKRNFTYINLWQQIRTLFFQVNIPFEEGLPIPVLSEQERKILAALRSGEYTEMKIKFSDDRKPQTIYLKEEVGGKDAAKRASEALLCGDFEDVSFKKRKGQVVYFEREEVVKLASDLQNKKVIGSAKTRPIQKDWQRRVLKKD